MSKRVVHAALGSAALGCLHGVDAVGHLGRSLLVHGVQRM